MQSFTSRFRKAVVGERAANGPKSMIFRVDRQT